MPNTILDTLEDALKNLDWKFITPSRCNYKDNEQTPIDLKIQKWQERMFAYELYHQLRVRWDANPELQKEFVIHAEVRKAYQRIKDFDWMPDFIFHLPNSGNNVAVVEIKRASQPYNQIFDDIRKLWEFKQRLGYLHTIEILFGTRRHCEKIIRKLLKARGGTPIDLFCVFTEDNTEHKKVELQRITFEALPE